MSDKEVIIGKGTILKITSEILSKLNQEIVSNEAFSRGEKIIQEIFFNLLSCDKISEERVDYSPYPGGKFSFIDFILAKKIGVEIKLLDFPKTDHYSPSQSLHDIGQICGDIMKLSYLKDKEKRIKIGAILLIVNAQVDLTDMEEKFVLRSIADQFFSDFYRFFYCGGSKIDKIKNPDHVKFRKDQFEVFTKIGFDKPFMKDNNIFSGATISIEKNIISIYVDRWV